MKKRRASALLLGLCLLVGGLPACRSAETPSGSVPADGKGETTMASTGIPETTEAVQTTTGSDSTAFVTTAVTTRRTTVASTAAATSATKQTANTTTGTQSTATATETGRQPGEPQTIALTDEHVKYIGRTNVTEQSAWMDWGGSGFELNVRGGQVRARLFAVDAGDANCAYISVEINGQRTQKIRLTGGSNWYTLADNLPEGKATNIRVLKLSEAQQGTATLQGLEITGETVAPNADKDRKIVWIGDSITAGYGILAQPNDPFTCETEDATLTYAWLVSEYLEAERHILAASGYGVATSNSGSTTSGIFPPVYPYISLARGTGEDQKWDYSAFEPDLVVVNLGTNDAAGGSNAATLRTGIRQFLTQLRTAHPRATIVWIYGFMIDQYAADIRQEVEAFAQTDDRVHYIQLTKIQGTAEIGGGGHPSAAAHERLALSLGAELQALMGWS